MAAFCNSFPMSVAPTYVEDGEIKFVRCFTRKRESAYYGEVYYTVLVEEKDDD